MYKCQLCKKQIGKGIPQMKKILEKRTTEKGWEIAKEIKLCPECYGGEKNESMVLREVQDTLQQQHGIFLPVREKQRRIRHGIHVRPRMQVLPKVPKNK